MTAAFKARGFEPNQKIAFRQSVDEKRPAKKRAFSFPRLDIDGPICSPRPR